MWKCANCGCKLVTERYHLYGKDYCRSCALNVPRQPRTNAWTETVRGTIIGGDYTRYEFHCSGGAVKSGEFDNDQQAIEWFKTTYPQLYAAGAEMRVFDI